LLISEGYLIFGARVWEATSESFSPLAAPVWVRDGKVEAVGAAAEAGFRGVSRRDATGRFLVPGLIDAHVHLELDPALGTPAQQLALPPERVAAAMQRRAQEMLFAGITTARDCGGGAHREHGLRDRIDRGETLGPRLICCGQPLTTPGGHCHFWGGAVSKQSEIAAVLARQIEAKSDWIKVMATGGIFTPGVRARDAQFELERLISIVEAAERAGRHVAAHCHGTQGIADAMRAGVRTIEHASFAGAKGFGTSLDTSLMREMARASLWVSPTVNAAWGRRIEDGEGAPTDFFLRMSQCLRRQRDAGIRFIASTDAGIPGIAHHDLVAGLLAFARFAELSPCEVLRAATSESARALGLEGETGRIAAGLSADMLLLEANPLEDLEAIRDPEVVVFRGAWHDRETRRRCADAAGAS